MGFNRGRILAAARVLLRAGCVCALVGPGLAYAAARSDGVSSSYSNGRTRASASAANGSWSSTVSGANIKVGTSGPVAAPGGRSANVGSYATVSSSIAKRHIVRALPYVGVGFALYELWDSLGCHFVSGAIKCDAGASTQSVAGDCWQFSGQSTCYPTHAAAAVARSINGVTMCNPFDVTANEALYYQYNGSCGSGSPSGPYAAQRFNTTVQGCATGSVGPDGLCHGGGMTESTVTEAAAESKLDYMTLNQVPQYLDAALDALPMNIPQPVNIEEPVPNVDGPTTVTTGPNGTSTTTVEWEGDVPSGEPDVIDWDETSTTTDPEGTTETTSEDPLDDGPPEQKDFCVDNPGRVGCMEGGEPDDVEIPNADVNVAITPVTFGASDASCPSDAPLVTSWGTYYFKYDGMCMVAQGIRPIVLAMAWLAAGFILLGYRSED